MDVATLNINIADPDDIRAKFPEIERMVAKKHDEWVQWDKLAADLAKVAGVRRSNAQRGKRTSARSSRAPQARKPSAQDLVVQVVEAAGSVLASGEVAERVNVQVKEPIKRDTITWALWKAEQDGQVQKIKKGVYAPLGYKPSQSELHASRNGSDGARKAEGS